MTSYRYSVATTEAATSHTSKAAAIKAARAEAKAGRMAMVHKLIADDAGVIRTNLGIIHTSFPARPA